MKHEEFGKRTSQIGCQKDQKVTVLLRTVDAAQGVLKADIEVGVRDALNTLGNQNMGSLEYFRVLVRPISDGDRGSAESLALGRQQAADNAPAPPPPSQPNLPLVRNTRSAVWRFSEGASPN